MNAAVDEAISLEFLIYSASRPLPASKQSSKQICTFRITNKKRHDIPIERCSSLQMHVWWRLGRRNGQVALPLASTRCGGCSVRVGVLPLLEKALGLLDD